MSRAPPEAHRGPATVRLTALLRCCSASARCVADRPAIDVPSGRIAAHQIIDPRSGSERAADPGRGRPDHLCIMADIFPIPASAVVGKHAGDEEALLRSPAADHGFDAERRVRSHPQILARSAPLRAVRVLEPPGHRHLLRIGRGGAAERIIPDQRSDPGPRPLCIVRGEDPPGELRGERGLRGRRGCQSRRSGRRQSNPQTHHPSPELPESKLPHGRSIATEPVVHGRVSRSGWRKSQEWKEALNATHRLSRR